jgi:hypothetical protein
MNFGNSFYESFFRPDSDPERRAQLERLAARHRERGFLQIRSHAYNEETLFTLYAMQGGVSRSSAHRGLGTTILIDFFMGLAARGAKMCVASGTAYIMFDGSYELKAAELEGRTSQVIAFNNHNSLEEAPDDKYVWALPKSFPGTMISLRLDLKRSYTSKRVADSVCPRSSE